MMRKVLGFLLMLFVWPTISVFALQRPDVPAPYRNSYIGIGILGLLTLTGTIIGVITWEMPPVVAVSLFLVYEVEFAAALTLMLDERTCVSDD